MGKSIWACAHCNNTKSDRYEPILDCTKEPVEKVIAFRKKGYFGEDEKLEKAKEGAKITIPLEITLPEVSTEEIEALPYLNLLGTYTTYGGGTENRVANLKLAVEACDGVELQPGQIFPTTIL